MSDYRLWKTGSWETGPVIPRDRREMWFGGAAFSADGGVLAVARSLQHVQLLDFVTRQEILTLAAPDLPCLEWMCFSPDGLTAIDALRARPTTASDRKWRKD